MHDKSHGYSEGPPAVVVGLSITGLGTVRSLAKAGVGVVGVDSNLKQPSAHTRYCQKIACPDTNTEDKLLDTLIRISNRNKVKPVLFLSTDVSVLIASENREILREYYKFNLPSKSVVRTLMDKSLFAEFALKNGFAIPQTFAAEDLSEVKSVAKSLQYPCLIKPSFRTPGWDKATPIKVLKVFSPKELVMVYEKNSHLTEKFIIQELIPGADSEVYFCLLWYNSSSRPVASFTGRKLMQWLPETGSTCIAESCTNSIVLEKSTALFDAVKYKGIGSVEFKRDPRDGTFKIMEPTVGRADLQSAIGYHSGLNIPLLEYCDCSGADQPVMRSRKKRILWINEENLFWVLGNTRNRYSLSEWLRLITRKKGYALFVLSDIGPFFRFLIQITRILLTKSKIPQ